MTGADRIINDRLALLDGDYSTETDDNGQFVLWRLTRASPSPRWTSRGSRVPATQHQRAAPRDAGTKRAHPPSPAPTGQIRTIVSGILRPRALSVEDPLAIGHGVAA